MTKAKIILLSLVISFVVTVPIAALLSFLCAESTSLFIALYFLSYIFFFCATKKAFEFDKN